MKSLAFFIIALASLPTLAQATRPFGAAAADIEARVAALAADNARLAADNLALAARVALLEARPAPTTQPTTQPTNPLPPSSNFHPPTALDVRDFGAKGDGTADDTAAIQSAIDKAAGVVNGVPAAAKTGILWWQPSGGTVYLPAGVYKTTRPLKLYGMLTLYGDGPQTMVDARTVATGAIDLTGTELGGPGTGFYHFRSQIRDFAIMTGGHGFVTSHPGVIWTRIERVQLCTGGWGVYLPKPAYAQDTVIQDCQQINPGSGGVLLRGNQNTLARYYVSNGVGGPNNVPYRSPWETDKLAIIDVGGAGNTLTNNHVEFGVGVNADGFAKAAVLSYAIRDGYAVLVNNWHEMWPNDAFTRVGFSTLADGATVYGQFEEAGAVVRYVNGGKRGGDKKAK